MLFFTAAIKRTSLTVIGLAQYMNQLNFYWPYFYLMSSFDWVKGISFSLIWIGLMFCVLAILRKQYIKFSHKRPLITGRDQTPLD
ncbi:hypothetical protein AB6E88_21050 [Providencia hangzhouensis]